MQMSGVAAAGLGEARAAAAKRAAANFTSSSLTGGAEATYARATPLVRVTLQSVPTRRTREDFVGAALVTTREGLEASLIVGIVLGYLAKPELEARLANAIAAGSAIGLASVVFFAVLREGWETALFLFAVSESSTPLATGVGAVAGLVVSISLGVALYMGSRRLNLRQFFTVTGVLLIVFAAGLLAHATHEFQEAGLLPMTVEHVWDTNGVLSEDSTSGKFLTALYGYNGNPSLLELVVWLGFLLTGLALFLRPLVSWRRTAAPAQA